MSVKASPTVIGTFVIIGITLTLVAIVILGGGRLFHDTARVIVFFDGSVNGLREGSPVKFRGIDIGTVQDIRINVSGAMRDPKNIRIPVVLQIDEDRLKTEGVTEVNLDKSNVQAFVDQGLRAELATESLLTGLRYVSLDVKPDRPAKMVNDRSVDYPEIPSIRSPMEDAPDKLNKILSNLADVDVATLIDSIRATVDDAHRLLGSPHLMRTVAQLDTLTASLNRTATQLEDTARQLNPLVKSAHRLVAPDAPLMNQVDATLKELAAVARSLRRLSDQLSRDPGAILRGGRQ